MEVYVLMPVKKSIGKIFLGSFCFMLAIIALVMSCAGIMLFAAFAALLGAAGYWLIFRMNREYEYSYFDGEVRFARISNKSRRKRLGVYPMSQVIQIAPEEDRSVYRYLHDNTAKVKDYTSRRPGEPCYVMVVNQEGKTLVIKFEPDEKYLDAVKVKYAQRVICRK